MNSIPVHLGMNVKDVPGIIFFNSSFWATSEQYRLVLAEFITFLNVIHGSWVIMRKKLVKTSKFRKEMVKAFSFVFS